MVLIDQEKGSFTSNLLKEKLKIVENLKKVALIDVLRVHDYNYLKKIINLCDSLKD